MTDKIVPIAFDKVKDANPEFTLRTALQDCKNEEWDNVIIIGDNLKTSTISYLTSDFKLGDKLFMLEKFKLWLMGVK